MIMSVTGNNESLPLNPCEFKIIPLVGVMNIFLGSTKKEVVRLIGSADDIEIHEFPDGTHTESWSYPQLGLELDFATDDDCRLGSITVLSENGMLEGYSPVGLSEEDLLLCFPLLEFDEEIPGTATCYSYPDKEIMFWIVDDSVSNMTVFPEYDTTGEVVIWPQKNKNSDIFEGS